MFLSMLNKCIAFCFQDSMFLSMLNTCIVFVKGCSHGAIATAVFFPSQQMGCMGFNVNVHMVRLQNQKLNLMQPIRCEK